MSKLDIIKAALFTPGSNGWGLPLVIWGDPGIGKTFQIRQLAEKYDMDIEELTPGARGEGAFGVIPVPNGECLTYPMPDWALRITNKAAILFIDEGTTAPPAVQPALLGLVQFKTIGSSTLGSRVRPIMAANPPEIAAAGYEFPPTVSNRMGHLNWTRPDIGQWTEYLTQALSNNTDKISADLEEQRVMAQWSNVFSRAVGEYSGFLYRMPEFLHKMPKREDPQISRAWPSPRTNDLAVRALAGAYVHGLSESDKDEFIGAFVGDACSIEFSAWRKNADLPLPEELLTGKETFKHDAKRLDKTVAIMSSCVVHLSNTELKDRNNKAIKLWEIMLDVCEARAPDLVVSAARSLCRTASKLPDPRKFEAGKSVLKRLGSLLTLSGEI